MKKQLLILLTLATVSIINGQNNLEFNQTLNLNINGAGYTIFSHADLNFLYSRS